jgi:HEAT repeat protein
MLDTISKAFNIYPGEARLVSLMLLYSFSLGIVKTYFLTAASALFLEQFDSATLSYVFIAAGLVIVVLGTVNARLQARLAPPVLLVALLGFLVALVLAAWLGVALSQAGWLVFSLLVLYRITYSLSTFAYWSLAGYLFDVRQGKRLFGMIDTGEMIARILGGVTLPLVIGIIGTVNLMLVSALALAACLLIQLNINRREGKTRFAAAERPARTERESVDVRRLLGKPYIALMVVTYMLLTFIYYMVEFLLYQQTQQQTMDADAIASFLGVFLGWAQFAVLITKVFLSGRLLGRFGVRLGVLAHPVAYLVAFAALALVGLTLGTTATLFFYLVLAAKVTEQVLDHGLSSPTYRVLYKPLPPRTRVAAQSLIEVRAAPLAVALSGVALLIFAQFPAANLGAVIGIALVTSAVWTVLAVLLNRQYREALAQALTQRLLGSADIELGDSSTLDILKRRLSSRYPGEVIYALDILEELEGGALDLVDALAHPAADVRRYALSRLEALHYPVAGETLLTLIERDPAPTVQTAALRAFCALYPDQVVETLEPYLDSPQRDLRLSAMVGFLRYGDIEGITTAGQRLLLLIDSAREDDREFAAQVFGETAQRTFYRPLLKLMSDDSTRVRRVALRAAGSIGNPTLLPRLVDALDSPATDYSAVKALAMTAADALDLLIDAYRTKPQVRHHVIHILGQRGGERAAAFLIGQLDQPDRQLRSGALNALMRLRYRADPLDHDRIERVILDELADAARWRAMQAALGEHGGLALLGSAIDTHQNRLRRRLFQLLALLRDPDVVMNARDQLAVGASEQRAYALEALDVLLPGAVKAPLLALLEGDWARLQSLYPQPDYDRTTALRQIITSPGDLIDFWTLSAALYAVGRLADPPLIALAGSALAIPHPVITETALWVLNHLKQDARKTNMLLTVEKVIILKTVDLFSRIDDDLLAQVAAALRDEYFDSQQTIFSKGDVGNCMYVIVEGAVRIHDGARTLNELKPREIFGELALLDADVRSASATTRQPTTLLRLDQDIFFELLRDQSELAMGIIRVLTGRLRKQINRLDPTTEQLYVKIFGDDPNKPSL